MAVNIIYSVFIWLIIGVCVLRVWREGKNAGQAMEKATRLPCREKELTYAKIFGAAILFRVLIYAVSAVMIYMIAHKLTADVFFTHWTRWDANNYLRIAEGGYGAYTENGDFVTLAFFPLYPALIWVVHLFVRYMPAAALVTSSLCYGLACCYIYALARMDFDRMVSRQTVVFVSVFPFAFFYGAMMTESVFLLTTAMSLYYIRRNKWFAVGVCGALCAASRMAGILILLPAAVEWISEERIFEKIRQKQWRALGKGVLHVLPAGLAVTGSAAYLLINKIVAGDAFAFLEYQQKYWNHTNCYFGKTIGDIFTYAFSPGTGAMTRWCIWIPEAVIFAGAAVLLAVSARRGKTLYVLYTAIYIVVNCSVTWLISGARYMAAALPAFLLLTELCADKRVLRDILYGIFLLLFLFFLYAYLHSWQIM